MTVYKENIPEMKMSILFPLICFSIIFPFYFLGMRELYWHEGKWMAIALEMNLLNPLTVAHGEIVPNAFPIFPSLVKLFLKIGIPIELALRIVSVLSLGALSVLVWFVGHRVGGKLEAAVASCAVFSNLIVFEKALDGYPHFTGLFFIFAAWLIWFTFGVVRSSWNKAWIYSFFFCGLAFYSIGWFAVVYFLFPLIFMRRPLTIWRKIKQPGLYIGILILLSMISVWMIPRWLIGIDSPDLFRIIPNISWSEYFLHILTLPFEIMLRFMPWSLIAWAPFCVAYRPLDTNPIFSKFLRTIIISLFFFFWLYPSLDSRNFIFIAPALACLAAMNYSMVVRRNAVQLNRILKFSALIIIIMVCTVMLFYLLPEQTFSELITPKTKDFLNYVSQMKYIYVLMVSFAGILALIVLLSEEKIAIWAKITLLSVCLYVIYWSVTNPYKSMENEKRSFAAAIRGGIKSEKQLKDSFTIYIDRPIKSLYGESCYFGTKTQKIKSEKGFPPDQESVYLLSTQSPPYPSRHWDMILQLNYKSKNVYLWKGLNKQQL